VPDALSRRPDHHDDYVAPIWGTEYSDWPLYVYQYLRTGQIPEDCPEDLRRKVTNEAQHFVANDDNEMFQKHPDGVLSPYVPFHLRADLVDKLHRGQGHLSTRDLTAILKTRGWWPDMRTDIRTWLSRCPNCQIAAKLSTNQ
jgi:hypothetical protein